jgi:hypothetical protein
MTTHAAAAIRSAAATAQTLRRFAPLTTRGSDHVVKVRQHRGCEGFLLVAQPEVTRDFSANQPKRTTYERLDRLPE